jgi:addiction module HigA family antidote
MAPANHVAPEHPGPFIRRAILPRGLSVKKVAELLNIGRPALSNLLNGNAGLSREMALRLEKAFGAKSEDLLKLQADFDDFQTRDHARQIAVPVYAPPFLQLRAAEIEGWADRHHEARYLLPVLLRRLILTTGGQFTKVDFPAFDNADRPDWDGQVDAGAATPWIPAGRSGWEFGCSEDVRRKAADDYKARVTSVPADVRKNTTFVFVSPRNWPRTGQSKDTWVNAKESEGKWKAVRVLDASDLEQWLEQSVPAQSWMAERLGKAANDILSMDECWDRWSKVTKPELPKALFDGAINVYQASLQAWLAQPPTKPLVVSANSTEEALAFVNCALDAASSLGHEFRDRAIVIETVEALRKATAASSRFIAVIASPDVEAALAGLHKKQHTIIVRRRNAIDGQPDIALDLVDDKTLREALLAAKISEDDVARYARESGHSPTILRRRLSDVPEIKCPPWAQDESLAKKLVPLAFVGGWNAETKADQEILSLLADTSHDTVEDWIVNLSRCDQPPVWAIAAHRGVVSKIDVLFGIRQVVTAAELRRFFFTAHYVLSENDPALELEEEQRWAANIYGKSRDYSNVLREGICETLVLLAVHGEYLFERRFGINVRAEVDGIVRKLLTPLDAETWESQQNDLPRYAEAAPEVFLEILENDLASSNPQVLALLRPASSGVFGRCARSGLLWGLEILAWNPQRLVRVCRLLGRLCEPKIEDNWSNKPENSLASIFRAWVPQTAATVDERCKVLELLAREFPKVGWRLCLEQFDPHASIGHYSARPRWRNDAAGAGQGVGGVERNRTIRKALDIALSWPLQDERTLGDLTERLPGMWLEDQFKVWKLVNAWIASNPDEDRKAHLRERIRRSMFTRRGRKRGFEKEIVQQAKAVYDLLAPNDPVLRHQWLFARQWVDESFDDLEDDSFSVQRWERNIAGQRTEALKEVWAAAAYPGVVRLCGSGDASHIIGRILAAEIVPQDQAEDFVARLVSENVSRPIHGCISGFLEGLGGEGRDQLTVRLLNRFGGEGSADDDRRVRLLLAAPFKRPTWRHVDSLSPPLGKRYWKDVYPFPERHDRDEIQELVSKLLGVNRPRAAFFTVHFTLKQIEPLTLVRLLTEIATSASEPPDHYRLEPHYIAQSFKALEGAPGVTTEQLAQLEFMYLSALDDDEYGIPHLERQLSESPILFMQAIGLTYKRSDEGDDPPEWRPVGADGSDSSIAGQTYRLLHKARRIPGTRDDGTVDVAKLKSWIGEVMAMCRNYAREEVGGHVIGQFLAKSPNGSDGIWPSEGVRQALEEVGTKDIADGMVMGAFNSRGAVWRGERGNQEREEAAKYRKWAAALGIDYPFVSNLLEQIAKGYDWDAKWHDDAADVRRRIGH